MSAVKLLKLGLGLYVLGFALVFVAAGLGREDSLAMTTGLHMPYLSILILLLAGLCGLLAGVRCAARIVVASARRRRPFP